MAQADVIYIFEFGGSFYSHRLVTTALAVADQHAARASGAR